MKFFAAVPVLAGMIGLATAARENPFGIIAIRSGSAIHNGAVTASDFKFWVGVPTASFCPSNVGSACPSGKDTAFQLTDNGALILNVAVPGGQQVFVDANGALGYTQAHSAAIPAGASTTGWSDTNSELVFQGKTLVACPINGSAHQVVTSGSTFVTDKCIPFLARIQPNSNKDKSAWQYV